MTYLEVTSIWRLLCLQQIWRPVQQTRLYYSGSSCCCRWTFHRKLWAFIIVWFRNQIYLWNRHEPVSHLCILCLGCLHSRQQFSDSEGIAQTHCLHYTPFSWMNVTEGIKENFTALWEKWVLAFSIITSMWVMSSFSSLVNLSLIKRLLYTTVPGSVSNN